MLCPILCCKPNHIRPDTVGIVAACESACIPVCRQPVEIGPPIKNTSTYQLVSTSETIGASVGRLQMSEVDDEPTPLIRFKHAEVANIFPTQGDEVVFSNFTDQP